MIEGMFCDNGQIFAVFQTPAYPAVICPRPEPLSRMMRIYVAGFKFYKDKTYAI